MKSSRIPFVLFALANLLAGVIAGMARIGWTWARSSPSPMSEHGIIMVGGFLATLIILEKALPLRKPYLLTFVIINASSLVFLALGAQAIAMICLVTGSVGLMWIYAMYLVQYPRDFSLWIMSGGAVLLLVGYIELLELHFYPQAAPWWIGFVLFTIVGERLELSKFLPVRNSRKYLLLVFLASYVVSLLVPFHSTGRVISGTSLGFIAVWLLRYDVISVAITKHGLTRFSAIALLCGYIGLLFTGAMMISAGEAAFGYDIVLHCFFLGFAFSMIFAHGPIILPGVLGSRVRPYSPLLFIPLAGLWLSLLVRVFSSMFWIPFEFRRASGWISFVSIFLYFLLIGLFTLTKKE